MTKANENGRIPSFQRGMRRGPVPGSPQAQRGGQATREKYGADFYRRIGEKGGKAVREQRGPDFYSEIGRKGGRATRDSQGPDFYQRIGQKGGRVSRRRHWE